MSGCTTINKQRKEENDRPIYYNEQVSLDQQFGNNKGDYKFVTKIGKVILRVELNDSQVRRYSILKDSTCLIRDKDRFNPDIFVNDQTLEQIEIIFRENLKSATLQ